MKLMDDRQQVQLLYFDWLIDWAIECDHVTIFHAVWYRYSLTVNKSQIYPKK